VFAFPGGGSNLDLIEELGARGVGVVAAHSEGGAAFMAATSGDLSGRPGTLLIGLGPGVANAVNGVAHAWLDQSPLLVVSDRFAAHELDTSGHQVLDHAALLEPVTKWQVTLTASNARAAVRRAVAEATTPPCGPVHIELPRDVAAVAVAVADAPAAEPARVAVTPEIPAAVAAALTAARQPLLLVGDEAARVPQEALVALAEQLRAPVLTSYKGKGVFPERHPLWCGIVTNAAVESDVLLAADAIVAIGLDPVELLPRRWDTPQPLLSLRAHDEAAPGYGAGCELIGDVPALVRALVAALGECASNVTPEDVAASRGRMLSRLRIRRSSPQSRPSRRHSLLHPTRRRSRSTPARTCSRPHGSGGRRCRSGSSSPMGWRRWATPCLPRLRHRSRDRASRSSRSPATAASSCTVRSWRPLCGLVRRSS
jgi:acetolactate synthase-1/2/3 large subunit